MIDPYFGRGFLLPLLSPFIHKLNKWTIKKIHPLWLKDCETRSPTLSGFFLFI